MLEERICFVPLFYNSQQIQNFLNQLFSPHNWTQRPKKIVLPIICFKVAFCVTYCFIWKKEETIGKQLMKSFHILLSLSLKEWKTDLHRHIRFSTQFYAPWYSEEKYHKKPMILFISMNCIQIRWGFSTVESFLGIVFLNEQTIKGSFSIRW